MAIYHFSAQMISRSKGQSAVASSAYRSGERLTDERTGEKKYYKRNVQPENMIIAPSYSPEWVYDRNHLWNEVERSETRKNSQLAREINIALPVELSKEEQKELITQYVQSQFVNKGMIADVAIHRDDKNNPHAHVMLTTREITTDGFGKKNRDWNDRSLLEEWREQWSEHANLSLEKVGSQERISHLSNEARGLEQLPTIHLGHVAHEMEQKGIQTDRGNINRERKEYNAIVVDLQKYREEKKALEQERARKQEQKQKAQKYHTAAERVDLQHAAKLLKTEPTLQNIKKRHEQLNTLKEQVHENERAIRFKDGAIKGAADHFTWIDVFKNRMKEANKRIESINWLNPLKLKENRLTKEKAEKDILKAKKEIAFHHNKLKDYRKSLGFQTKKEFYEIQQQHETERPGLLKKHEEEKANIRFEGDVLQKAEIALKRGVIRQVASLYPERPEMPYINYETAQKLMHINKGQDKAVSIETIEHVLSNRKQAIQQLQDKIEHIDSTKSRLQNAKSYLNQYENYQAIVEKYENNPFLKGKRLLSKTTKEEYEHAVSSRNSYKNRMKHQGVSDRDDLKKQTYQLQKAEKTIPEIKEKIQSQEEGLGMLESVIKGIEQAQREMFKAKLKQQVQQSKSRSHSRKKRPPSLDMER